MKFYETLRGVIIVGFGFGPTCLIVWFLFERLEVFLKEGYNPIIQLITFFPRRDLSEWIGVQLIYDYIASTSMFQWDAIRSIVGWIQLTYDFILHLPIELWILVCWPIFSWIGFKISIFMKR
jgi:hypothetical protein